MWTLNMNCRMLLVILVLVPIFVHRRHSALAASQASAGECLQQFSIVVATSAPLGLRLSEKLEVLEFVADPEGRGRAVEASGLAEIGDRLIAVNNVSFVGYGLQRAVQELQAAQLPRTLHFQPHDGRCIKPPVQESIVDAGTAATRAYEPIAEESFDYVVSSVGDKTSELKLYGVLSSDGSPPSCAFRELILARPFDACAPLSIDATDKYVLVPSVMGCPMHQKAALTEEAGAKGVVFVQRLGEKPMRVRIPLLPHPIHIPIVMVSADSGTRLLEQMSAVRPGESQQLRLVFSPACAVDRFTIHPDANDPLRRSAAILIEEASAGFMSVYVATSAETELITDTYEFLKPAYSSSADNTGSTLPIGRHDLIFPDTKVLDPCKADPTRLLPHSSQSNMENLFLAIRLRDPKSSRGCSIMQQLAYFQARRPSGIILGDPQFPHAANTLSTAVAVQQIKVPVVFISIDAFQTIRRKLRDLKADATISSKRGSGMHIHVEFSGENALEHQWKELASLAVESNWPATEAARDRLFHRMLKDQAALDDHDLQLSLVKNERYEALVASYWRAQRYYSARADEIAQGSQQEGNEAQDN